MCDQTNEYPDKDMLLKYANSKEVGEPGLDRVWKKTSGEEAGK